MLSVSNGITDDLCGPAVSTGEYAPQRDTKSKSTTYVLEEDLEDTTRLLVDEAGDTFHTATTRETTDGGLGDSL